MDYIVFDTSQCGPKNELFLSSLDKSFRLGKGSKKLAS